MRPRILVFLACVACGCSSSRPQPVEGRVVSAEELPAAQREVWQLYQAGGAKWDAERERVLADPGLARFLVDNLLRELVRSYDRSRLSRPGEQPGPFERAGAELVACAARSTQPLVEMLCLKDGVVAFLAADVLARIGVPALEPVCAKLEAPEIEVRRRAGELLGRLPHAGEAETRVEQLLGKHAEQDPAWIVRAQSAEALGARGARHTHKGYAAGVLARCLSDADASVAESAAKGLRALAEPRAIPLLIDALERNAARGELGALRATQAALRELSGEVKDRSPEEWRRWWRETGERELVH